MLSRRSFIIAFVLAIPALLGGVLLFFNNSAQSLVISVVRKHLPDLIIDEQKLRSFADDFLKYQRSLTRGASFNLLVKFQPFFLSPVARLILPMRFSSKLDTFEGIVMSNFLLSTNYFLRESESDEIVYLNFANPYALGCANHLARFDFA